MTASLLNPNVQNTMSDAVNVTRLGLNGNGKHHKQAYFLGDAKGDGEHFRLDDDFISNYLGKSPDFGYNGLGEFVFFRTYSRLKADNTKETALDVFRRAIEGCYEIQRRWCRRIHVPWDYDKALVSAREMFERMWAFKFLPPGRGLWCMGTPFMWERGSAALQNCAFISTEDITTDPAEPFCFLMDMSMVGVGVGFDTRGANKITIVRPNRLVASQFVVPDSREGWVESVRLLLDAYLSKPELGNIDFDYSLIRPAGTPIRGFGGTASGPDNLAHLHSNLRELFEANVGRRLNSTLIVDLMNMIGACVVAGNVRRSSEIAFGDADDFEYAALKNVCSGMTTGERHAFLAVTGILHKRKITKTTVEEYRRVSTECGIYPNQMEQYLKLEPIPEDKLRRGIETWNAFNQHRWVSNNSVFATVGMDYTELASHTAINGEPGYIWLDNMRDFGRMADGRKPGIDARAMGTNPCGEQTLESGELCNLVETFPSKHESSDDYLRTLKFAYLFAKTVTLLPTHNARTNAVMLRNRRIGLSQSGIVAAFQKFGRRTVLRDFCDAGYHEIRRWDKIYSDWLCVSRSNKITSIKPSGTVSLLVGVPPGIHYPEGSTYWRRVRIGAGNSLIKIFKDAGYDVEQAYNDPKTMIIKFAVDESYLPNVKQTNIWQQVVNVVDYQRYWTDNQPSCTIRFKPEERGQIKDVLETFEDQLKAISMLPVEDHGYRQAPYEDADPAEVKAYNARLQPIDFARWITDEAIGTKFCDNEKCEIVHNPNTNPN